MNSQNKRETAVSRLFVCSAVGINNSGSEVASSELSRIHLEILRAISGESFLILDTARFCPNLIKR